MEDKRDEKLKEIVALYETEHGHNEESLVECPNCKIAIDTEFFEICGFCAIQHPEAVVNLKCLTH